MITEKAPSWVATNWVTDRSGIHIRPSSPDDLKRQSRYSWIRYLFNLYLLSLKSNHRNHSFICSFPFCIWKNSYLNICYRILIRALNTFQSAIPGPSFWVEQLVRWQWVASLEGTQLPPSCSQAAASPCTRWGCRECIRQRLSTHLHLPGPPLKGNTAPALLPPFCTISRLPGNLLVPPDLWLTLEVSGAGPGRVGCSLGEITGHKKVLRWPGSGA